MTAFQSHTETGEGFDSALTLFLARESAMDFRSTSSMPSSGDSCSRSSVVFVSNAAASAFPPYTSTTMVSEGENRRSRRSMRACVRTPLQIRRSRTVTVS